MNYKFISRAHMRAIMAIILVFNCVSHRSIQAKEYLFYEPYTHAVTKDSKEFQPLPEKNELSKKVKQLSETYSVPRETLIKLYAMEKILKRISVSQYRNNLALAGSFVCYSFLGLDGRTPQDLDLQMQGLPTDENNIKKVISEILSISLDDNIKFKISKTTPLKAAFRLHIICSIDKLEIPLYVDCITDKKYFHETTPIDLKLLFGDETITISSCSIESELSDKITASLKRNIKNIRLKDYYDIWFIYKNYSDKINPQTLARAFEISRAFKNPCDIDYKDTLKTMRKNSNLKKKWIDYQKQNKFAENIDILHIFDIIENIIQHYNLL